MEKDSKVFDITIGILVLLSAIAAVVKIIVGFEMDEGFIIALGMRILNGEHWFKDMWEIYQTSSIFITPFLYVYRSIVGSLDGIVIFLRIVSTLIHILIACFVYKALVKHGEDKKISFLMALVWFNLMPRSTQNIEYGILMDWFVTLSMFVLLNACKKMDYYIAGLWLALAVLAYPTVVIIYPVMIFGIYKLSGKISYCINFTLGCFTLAVITLIYVFVFISPADLIKTLPYIFMDASHSGGTERLVKLLKELAKISVRAGLALAVAGIMTLGMKKVLKIKTDVKEMILTNWITAFVLIIIAAEILGRKSGVVGLQTRYIVVYFLGAYFYINSASKRDRKILIYTWIPALFILMGVLCGSNLGIETNSSYLIPGLIASMSMLLHGSNDKKLMMSAIVMFAFCSILYRGYFVRNAGTSPCNVLEARVKVSDGIARGIWLKPEEKRKYDLEYQFMRDITDDTDRVLCLTSDPQMNLMGNGSFTSVTSHGTVVYDEQWKSYYTKFDRILPTKVIIDKSYVTDTASFLENNIFGKWINSNYKIEEETNDFIKLVPLTQAGK